MRILRYLLMSLTGLILLTGMEPLKAADNGGRIYGKITTRKDKSYTGTLRWGKQECFWDDLFNATKEDNPWKKYAKDIDSYGGFDNPRPRIKVFGMTITGIGISSYTHMFISQFGDIRRIEVRRKDRTTIIMKSGTEYEVSGYGDVGETIEVLDESLGKLKIQWDEIRTIDFMPTPASAKGLGYRLKGKVITDEMEFNGYIMWDAEECLSTDLLDGESEVGDMSIEMGNIRSIKRESSQSCTVNLKDGREFELRGTNDVNRDNRGIYVYDERFGKIEISWDELREVIYSDDDGTTGKSYDSYAPARKLAGKVTAWGNKEYSGRIVFDFDEEETCDILNGKLDDMDFTVPFEKIVSIIPKGKHSSEVEFAAGHKLRLEDSQDVTASNSGVLIFKDKGDTDPKYVAWEDVEKITFVK